jgi:hypothetical protein
MSDMLLCLELATETLKPFFNNIFGNPRGYIVGIGAYLKPLTMGLILICSSESKGVSAS